VEQQKGGNDKSDAAEDQQRQADGAVELWPDQRHKDLDTDGCTAYQSCRYGAPVQSASRTFGICSIHARVIC
jgi:hypothetical protein